MDVKKLTDEEIKAKRQKLPGWDLNSGKLHKLFKFKNFNEAMRFIVGTAMVCEKMNHHPEWLNVYGNVDVKLTTHRVAGITELDFELASNMNEICSKI